MEIDEHRADDQPSTEKRKENNAGYFRAQTANQWRSLAPLEGGTVNALLEKDGVIYAGTSTTGIFTSSDNGKTWRAASNGLHKLVINALATAGGNVLAATNSGVYRSSDGAQKRGQFRKRVPPYKIR